MRSTTGTTSRSTIKGHTIRSGGHGFCGIGRKRLLNILQARCEELGVKLVFETDVQSDEQYPDADLVIASDGLNSRIRAKYAGDLPARHRHARLPLRLARHEEAVRRVHLRLRGDRARLVPGPRLPLRRRHLDLHRRDAGARLARRRPRQDGARRRRIAFCERLFAKHLDGHPLISNATPPARLGQWIQLPARRLPDAGCTTTAARPVVLMGDAAHTAHFSIGSGTKLALEDAIELARSIAQAPAATCARRWPTTRRCAASRCCGSRTRRATRPNGSSTSTATPTCRPSSSPTRC